MAKSKTKQEYNLGDSVIFEDTEYKVVEVFTASETLHIKNNVYPFNSAIVSYKDVLKAQKGNENASV